MYRFNLGAARRAGIVVLAVALTTTAWNCQTAVAANATVLDTDPNADGLGFGKTDAFVFGPVYSQDVNASLNGNAFLVQTQNGTSGNTGAGISVPVSNGENGIAQSLDGSANEIVNPDAPNATPANSVFAAIGNASGKLENGNVLRFSMWMRSDPASPLTKAPQIEPVLKFEIWKEALSNNADTTGGVSQPGYGDKIVDTDQHLGKGIWVDVDNNGSAIDGNAAADGRLKTITTTAWTLIETSYVVNDAEWLGIFDDPYTVSQVEEVRGVMFWGDFASTDLTNGGSLWIDNIQMEVFKNQAAVTANANPRPKDLPGDFDNDKDVDGTDFALWSAAFGSTAVGDADDDKDSDGNDFLLWQQNFNKTLPAIAAVPEPGSALLAIAALAAAGGLRRNK